MENTNGIKNNKENLQWSKGYCILVRFFKECGVYQDFKRYQAESKYPIPLNSQDIIGDYGKAFTTSFFESNCHKIFSYSLFETFIKFIKIFYPNCVSNYDWHLQEKLCYPIDVKKRIIMTEYSKTKLIKKLEHDEFI